MARTMFDLPLPAVRATEWVYDAVGYKPVGYKPVGYEHIGGLHHIARG